MLALWQAEWVAGLIKNLHPEIEVVLNKIKTTGDKILDVPLAKVGGKGLFVKEIEEALSAGSADLAVHSMKDVPVEFPKGLHLAAVLKREETRDALVAPIDAGGRTPIDAGGRTPIDAGDRIPIDAGDRIPAGVRIDGIHGLPRGARVGTSSLRRASQLLALRPDLNILQLRGNVDTRIKKLDEGQYDAVVLAAAALIRLGIQGRLTHLIPFEASLPAVGQGAVGIECRAGDEFINALLKPLNDAETSLCVRAERAFLRRLQGGCQVPIAASARLLDAATLEMDGLVGSVDGKRIIRGSISGNGFGGGGNIPGCARGENSLSLADALGTTLADDLLSRGAREILQEVYEKGY
jgi:hydroxymethylbilane synthase